MRNTLGHLLLAWSTIGGLFDVVCLLQWLLPDSGHCNFFSWLQLVSLCTTPMYFVVCAVLLWRIASNPFKIDGELHYHAFAILVGAALGTASYFMYEHQEIDIAPGQPCPHPFLNMWATYWVDRALLIPGVLFIFRAGFYMKTALSQSETLSNRKQIFVKTLMVNLMIDAGQQLVMPSVVVYLKDWRKSGEASMRAECVMQGIGGSIPVLVWLAVFWYFSKLLEEASQDEDKELSFDLRRQVIKSLSEGISKSAKKYQALAQQGNCITFDFDTEDFHINDVKVTARYPHAFHELRENFKIKLEEYIESINGKPAKEKFTEGKSGAFMYFTEDDRFIIKTATAEEFRLLFKMLPGYHKHMKLHPHSLINPIVGAYELYLYQQHIHVLVVGNCFFQAGFQPQQRFDLKGSWVGRAAKLSKKKHLPWDKQKIPSSGIQKDLDIDGPLLLTPETAHDVGRTLRADSAFLAEHDVMDYSLLVGTSKHIDVSQFGNQRDLSGSSCHSVAIEGTAQYCIGVIDVLQEFTLRKKLEYFLLTYILRKGPGVSCVPPAVYAQRFTDNIVSALIEKPQLDLLASPNADGNSNSNIDTAHESGMAYRSGSAPALEAKREQALAQPLLSARPGSQGDGAAPKVIRV